MLKLTPKFRGFKKSDNSAYYVYNVTGTDAEKEEYIRVRTTLGENPMAVDSITARDSGEPIYFSKTIVDYDNVTLNLTDRGGFFVNDETSSAMLAIAEEMGQSAVDSFNNKRMDRFQVLLSEIIAKSGRKAPVEEAPAEEKTSKKAKAKAEAQDDIV